MRGGYKMSCPKMMHILLFWLLMQNKTANSRSLYTFVSSSTL